MNKYQMPEVLTKKNSTLPLANNVGLELSLNSARRCKFTVIMWSQYYHVFRLLYG